MTTKRRDGPTPSGGAYSIAFFADDNGNEADESVATQCIFTEYGPQDQFVHESVGPILRGEGT